MLGSTCALIFLSLGGLALGHGDHGHVEEGHATSGEPIDAILWTHIILMSFSFGIIFPMGMVLGITRSRWHVPLQVLGTIIAVVAYFLGHAHKGRAFAENVHAKFANVAMLWLIVQVVIGAYLKLHLERGIHKRVRPIIVVVHGVVGKALPIISWTQMIFGGITSLGFCRGGHMGQCAAHFIMGSAFIAYGILLTVLLLVGQFWLHRTGRSQEFFDSAVIAVWGCINTFTEHRWGTAWVKNDLQHTTMGIVWWCAGLLGMFLSRKRNGRPKRNLIPSLVLFMTGWAMSAHPQTLHISEAVHSVFGYTLMCAGVARIIEISFVLKDRATFSPDGSNPHSWQYIPPFLLHAAGFLFLGATEEQMMMLHKNSVTHVAYILILFSIAFIVFLFTNLLLHIYAVHVWPRSAQPGDASEVEESDLFSSAESALGGNPSISLSTRHPGPGRASRDAPELQQVRDAQEFELEGLISSPSHARGEVLHGSDLPRDQFALSGGDDDDDDDDDDDEAGSGHEQRRGVREGMNEGLSEPITSQRKDYER